MYLYRNIEKRSSDYSFVHNGSNIVLYQSEFVVFLQVTV